MAANSRPFVRSSPTALFKYLAGPEEGARGRIIGKHAKRLGISDVGVDEFAALCGKNQLGISIDLSAPKWVSAALVTCSPSERQEILREWDEHAEEMFARVESLAGAVRVPDESQKGKPHGTKRQGSKTKRIPAELICMVTRHMAARPTAETEERGDPPDPHLHSHFFAFNRAWTEHGGQGRELGIDDDGIKRVLGQVAFESEGEFSRRMEDMGYRPSYSQTVFTDRDGLAKVAWRSSMPAMHALCDRLSSNARRAKALKEDFQVKSQRPPTDAEMRNMMRRTRRDKGKLSPEQMWEGDSLWKRVLSSAAKAGVACPRMLKFGPLERASYEERKALLWERLNAPEGLCSKDAVFGLQHARQTVAKCAIGLGFSLAELDAICKSALEEDLVLISPGGGEPAKAWWTTKRNVAQEAYVARRMKELVESYMPAPSPEAVERAIAALKEEEGIELDEEQTELVRVCCSGVGRVNVEGWAGTGKTTALKAVVRAFRDTASTGLPTCDMVISISTARDTGERTGAKLKADKSCSAESFRLSVQRKKIRPTERTVIVVDEAAMMDTPRIAKLLECAGPARVVLVGDGKQLQAIGAGGWHADQAKLHGAVVLKNVHRQKDQRDVAALAALRLGRAEELVASLESRGRLHVSEERAHAIGKVVADLFADRDAGRGPRDVRIVMDGKNEEIDQVNEIVQNDRIRRGELGSVFHEMRSLKTGREWKLRAGDECHFIAGYYDAGQRLNIPNGTQAKVAAVSPEVSEDGSRVVQLFLLERKIFVDISIPAIADEQIVGPCYAVHAMRLQGGEAPIIRAVPGKFTTSLEAGYSTLSRCVEEMHLYLDRSTHGEDAKAGIVKAWKKAKPKISARERIRRERGRADLFDPERQEGHLDLGPIFPDAAPMPEQEAEVTRRRRKNIREAISGLGRGIGLAS